ncbi:MAG: sorbosone dehydrogenase family protein, partial [Bacteroidota bacterium]|nr:sorbosone dehydrogenase family protein [Bacteroidota bacterium]
TSYSKEHLPAPYQTKSTTRFSKVLGWPKDKTPEAPAGFIVTRFAEGLDNPRWMYQAANGDIFIAESNTVLSGIKKIGAGLLPRIKTQHYGTSADRITIVRDVNKDGIYESRSVFLEGLNRPFGMLILNNYFYVANTDGVIRYPYRSGETKIEVQGKKIVDLPAGGYNNHWTRNIISNREGTKIYITVGSGSNAGENGMENEVRRANILEVNPDGTGEHVYASGLRNPVGLAWQPETETLWAAVNERDELGDELVPDYLTSIQQGGFYGWPYSYYGHHEDPRMKEHQRPDLVAKSIVPDVSLGSHTASLGLAFYNDTVFPAHYHNGAFIGQHGSWNRSTISGYKVVFVPFKNGKPSGEPEDFLTGFIKDVAEAEVYGRPVGVTVLADGSMLVADDASNVIWRVAVKK